MSLTPPDLGSDAASPPSPAGPARRLFQPSAARDSVCAVTLPADSASPAVCALLAEEAVRYLLFARGQTPMPLAQLERRLAGEKGEKRAADFLHASSALTSQLLPQLLELELPGSDAGRLTCALVLGASIASPKEVWVLDFRDIVRGAGDGDVSGEKENEAPAQREDGELTPDGSPERRRALVRSAMRQLVVGFSKTIDKNLLGPTAIHALCHAPRSLAPRLSSTNSPLLPFLTPRQTFRLKANPKYRTFRIVVRCGGERRTAARSPSGEEEEEEDNPFNAFGKQCSISDPTEDGEDSIWYEIGKGMTGLSAW